MALALAPIAAAIVGMMLYFLLLKRAERTGHLTQVLLTVGVIFMGIELIRIGLRRPAQGRVAAGGPGAARSTCSASPIRPIACSSSGSASWS